VVEEDQLHFVKGLIFGRLASAVLLRHFIGWLVGVNLHGLGGDYPLYQGWALAAALGCTGYVLCLIHHQLFWRAPLALQGPCWRPALCVGARLCPPALQTLPVAGTSHMTCAHP
jgi:hypothetical protein